MPRKETPKIKIPEDVVTLYLRLSPEKRRDLALQFELIRDDDATERDVLNLAHRWLRRAAECGALDADAFDGAVRAASRASL